MSKANKPGSQKPTTNNAAGAQKTTAQSTQTGESTSSSQPTIHRAKQGGKNRKSTIGGTAVQGSKSTQPKEIPTRLPRSNSRSPITVRCAAAWSIWEQAPTANPLPIRHASACKNG